ncbi:MAG: mechanosensitive ion channel [Clostridia bacterium]|nr:mechanosensitive ion channel [Clostridia bacterium]
MNFFQLALTESNLIQLFKDGDYDTIISRILEKAPSVIAALAIVIIGYIISKFIGKLVVKAMSARGVDPSIHSFIRTVITLLLNFVFILSALSTLGIDVNSFVAALGAAGITAGIGLQSSISQIASGVQILVNHPFKSGDYIDVGTASGKVQEIKIMYTVLITVDNKRVIIPNSYITSNNIVNYNAEDRRRLDLIFSISYDADIEKQGKQSKRLLQKTILFSQTPSLLLPLRNTLQAQSISPALSGVQAMITGMYFIICRKPLRLHLIKTASQFPTVSSIFTLPRSDDFDRFPVEAFYKGI